jgi:putative RecB family exonuclease
MAVAGEGQQELAGMPIRLYPCTPTRLTTWVDCARRYRFAYLDRPTPPKGPPWAHNSVGAAVHSALADWWTLPVTRREPAAAVDLLRRRWLNDGFRDLQQSAEAGRRAAGWMTGYLEKVDPAAEPVGVERTVSTKTGTLVLSGRVDRIDDRPVNRSGESGESGEDGEEGGLVIVDYKTGRYVPDADDARTSLALGVYAVAAARTFRRDCFQVELHHLPSDTRAVARHTSEGLARKVAEAESIASDCSRADTAYRSEGAGTAGPARERVFPPSPGPGCSWCDFRRHCPEGQAAAPDREPWSSLAT